VICFQRNFSLRSIHEFDRWEPTVIAEMKSWLGVAEQAVCKKQGNKEGKVSLHEAWGLAISSSLHNLITVHIDGF
jgi:hypothetical protein